MSTSPKNPNYYGPLDNDFAQQLGNRSPSLKATSTALLSPPNQENRSNHIATVTPSPSTIAGRLGNRNGAKGRGGGGIGNLRASNYSNQHHVEQSGLNQRIQTERRAAGREQDPTKTLSNSSVAAKKIYKDHEKMIASNKADTTTFSSANDTWKGDDEQLDEALKAAEGDEYDTKITSIPSGTKAARTESPTNTGVNATITASSTSSAETLPGNPGTFSGTGDAVSTTDVGIKADLVAAETKTTDAIATNGSANGATLPAEHANLGDAVPLMETKWNFQIRPSYSIEDFNIEEILSGIIVALTSVDSFAYIKSWNDPAAPPITSVETLPKTDVEMGKYVEDPHTVPGGTHGKIFGRLTFVTSIQFEKIKNNNSFNRWIRHVGLFLDKSELRTTRPKSLGFFTYHLPHYSRTDFFAGFIGKLLGLSRFFQILPAPIYAENGNTKKCFAYSILTANEDATIIYNELTQLKNNEFLQFYSWDAYSKKSTKDKHIFVDGMINTVATKGCLLFDGLVSNELMRDDSSPPIANSKKRNQSGLQDAAIISKQILDSKYGKVRCLDFIRDYFQHSDGSDILLQIRGPVNNQIEITFAEADRLHAHMIDRLFLPILAAHMSDESIQKSFSNWEMIQASIGSHEPWVPPETRQARARRGRQPVFSFTKTASVSYMDAARQGMKKVDIPLTLAVTRPSQSQQSTSTAVTSLTSESTATTVNNAVLYDAIAKLEAKLVEQQKAFETLCAQQHSNITQSIEKLKIETKQLKADTSKLATEVDGNQKEAFEIISKLHDRSASQLTSYVDYRFNNYSTTTTNMLQVLLQKAGVPDEDIKAMIKVELPPFDFDPDNYRYDDEPEDDEDDDNMDNQEYDNNPADDGDDDNMENHEDDDEHDDNMENDDPLRDGTEDNNNKSTRIASPSGLVNPGHQHDRPADRQMATGSQ